MPPKNLTPEQLETAVALYRAVSTANLSITDRLIHIVSEKWESAVLVSDHESREAAIKAAVEDYVLFLHKNDVNCV